MNINSVAPADIMASKKYFLADHMLIAAYDMKNTLFASRKR